MKILSNLPVIQPITIKQRKRDNSSAIENFQKDVFVSSNSSIAFTGKANKISAINEYSTLTSIFEVYTNPQLLPKNRTLARISPEEFTQALYHADLGESVTAISKIQHIIKYVDTVKDLKNLDNKASSEDIGAIADKILESPNQMTSLKEEADKKTSIIESKIADKANYLLLKSSLESKLADCYYAFYYEDAQSNKKSKSEGLSPSESRTVLSVALNYYRSARSNLSILNNYNRQYRKKDPLALLAEYRAVKNGAVTQNALILLGKEESKPMKAYDEALLYALGIQEKSLEKKLKRMGYNDEDLRKFTDKSYVRQEIKDFVIPHPMETVYINRDEVLTSRKLLNQIFKPGEKP